MFHFQYQNETLTLVLTCAMHIVHTYKPSESEWGKSKSFAQLWKSESMYAMEKIALWVL